MGKHCAFCDTEAEWAGEVRNEFTFESCDLHRATLEVDAAMAGHQTTWRALSRDAGGLAAMAVVFLAPFHLPGCDAAEKSDPTLVALGVIAVVIVIAAMLVRFGPREWFVGECGGCGNCVDCDEELRS